MKRIVLMILGIGLFGIGFTGLNALAEGNARGLDRHNLDTTCSPCQDFYQFANGTWLKENPVPAAYSSWSVDDEMRERNNTMLKEILESAAKDAAAPKGSNRQKIGDFYATAMDSAAVESEGYKPIQPELEKIAAIKSVDDLRNVITQFHTQGNSVLFNCGSEQDLKENTQVIAYATQGGLGLPDRDYYTKTDEESQKLRDQYLEHVAAMLQLLGDKPEAAKAAAQSIMTIETRLAKASLTNVELRDPNNYYNVMTVADADKASPSFPWTAYFKGIGYPTIERFSYAHPKFFAAMDSLLTEQPLSDWKNYLRWHVVHGYAAFMSSPFVNENFKFYAATLSGAKELRPRWKRVLSTINYTMGEALGELYVERAFPPHAKARANEMIENLKKALAVRIKNLPWMTDATKEMALKKLSTFTSKIGYPDKFRDYSALTIDRSSYVANMRRASAFEYTRGMNKIGKPVDKTEWGMPPQTINAYYNPLLNEICFPAAILQPPMFDGDIDDAVNYGAMGAIIGHEISHGFDDQGSQFDADGNMKMWWTDADRTEFERRAGVLVTQFDNYLAVDSLHINGKLTLGENIGDLAGLLVAFDGLQLALAGKEHTPIDGFAPEQRFFLSFAQAWRSNQRPEGMKLQINTDVHSPAKWRVLGPLSNIPAFRQAFGCKPGDEMVRSDSLQVQIW
jgi:putative endopeptidase